MVVNITIQGLDKLALKWKNIPTSVKKYTAEALMKAGYVVEREAKTRTPVEFGRLRDSINTTARVSMGGTPAVVVAPHTDYAIFVEKRKAKHKVGDWKYMERGLQASRGQIKLIMKSFLNQVVKAM